MFDLDLIEDDWKKNSFQLTDEEVFEIYKSEGVTKKEYEIKREEIINRYKKISPEERLLINIFGDEKAQKELEEIDKECHEKLKAINLRLSHSSQMKVVEGTLDVVFDSTRYWYEKLNESIPMEEIYYLSVDSLMNAAKYCIHFSTKMCFRSYAYEFIRRNMISLVARKEHISYRNAYCIIYNRLIKYYEENRLLYNVHELSYDYTKEIPYNPSSIYEMIRKEWYEDNYIKNISSEEFIKDYNCAIKGLDNLEQMIIKLLYDKNGLNGLTFKEISEFLGIPTNKVYNIKKKVIRKLNKNARFYKYINN